MNASTSGVIPGSTSAKLVAGAVILFVALVLMFALNAKYHFLPAKWNLFKQVGLVGSSDGTYWTNPNARTALVLNQSQLPSNFPQRYGYTLMFDTIIFNSRVSLTGGLLPYRHLLHRGSDDLGNAGTAAGCKGGSSSTGTTTTGLPTYMNPGFIGDPTTNDILVFIDTSAGRESARISNLSLSVPYRIGIIVYEGFFELYLGCRLLTTQVLKGIPLAINPSGVYALAGPFALTAKVQNLRVWNTPLPVQEIVEECKGAIQPFGAAPPCVPTSVGIPPPPPTPDTAASATIASVTQCPSSDAKPIG
jgi:hypothetical protein